MYKSYLSLSLTDPPVGGVDIAGKSISSLPFPNGETYLYYLVTFPTFNRALFALFSNFDNMAPTAEVLKFIWRINDNNGVSFLILPCRRDRNKIPTASIHSWVKVFQRNKRLHHTMNLEVGNGRWRSLNRKYKYHPTPTF